MDRRPESFDVEDRIGRPQGHRQTDLKRGERKYSRPAQVPSVRSPEEQLPPPRFRVNKHRKLREMKPAIP